MLSGMDEREEVEREKTEAKAAEKGEAEEDEDPDGSDKEEEGKKKPSTGGSGRPRSSFSVRIPPPLQDMPRLLQDHPHPSPGSPGAEGAPPSPQPGKGHRHVKGNQHSKRPPLKDHPLELNVAPPSP